MHMESNNESHIERIAAMSTFCSSIPTEDMKGKTVFQWFLGECQKAVDTGFVAPETPTAFLASMNKGPIASFIAQMFSDQFMNEGAHNYLEQTFNTPAIGDFTVTIQRKEGQTPVDQLELANAEIERLRKELCGNKLTDTTLPITKTAICHKIDYSALERWAAEKLGIPILEFIDMDNDTDHEFEVISRHNQKYPGGWDQETIDETIDSAKSRGAIPIYRAGNLLSYFADAGLIPEGCYIVNVSW